MRIFYAFLVLVVAVILWMLPMTEAIYDFRTDVRQDTFNVDTASGITSANVTLLDFIYEEDTNTISYNSSIEEVPVFSSYNGTTKQLLTINLTDNTTRTLIVSYDVDALTDAGALDALMDKVPFIWLLMIISFPIAALAAIFLGRT